MSTIYMRSGKDQQYLHLSDCPRYGWLARLLGRFKPWTWAEEQDRSTVYRAVYHQKLKLCLTCQPFAMRKRSQ